MRRSILALIAAGLAAVAATGCSGLDGLLEIPAELSAARPAAAPAPAARPAAEAPPSPPPRPVQPPPPAGELERLPKIDPVDTYHGQETGVIYSSSAPLAKIVAFYQAMLAKEGWKNTETLTDNVHYANLNFNRNKELVIVSLGSDASASPPRVMVSLTPHGSMKVKDLPRYPGTKTLAEFDHTAIYLTADKVDKVEERTADLLAKAGWRERAAPAGGGDTVLLQLEKGEMLLEAFIGVAPAQGNQTTIQYSLRKKDR